jgi:hypothetical protein
MNKSSSKSTKSSKIPATKPSNGQTGPITDAGKAISSRNAIKTGLHASGWIDTNEELEYQELFNNLCKEYDAKNTTLLLQIERMASTMVKMRRLQKIEAALFQKARGLAEFRAQERQSIPSLANADPEQAFLVAQLSAMPDMDRLASLQRYQTSLDRQLSKVIGEIRVLTMNPIDTLHTPSTKIQRELRNTKTVQKGSDGSASIITTIDE